MDVSALIPKPDTIPAPPWFFDILDILLFLIHIILVNIVVGTSLIALFSSFGKGDESQPPLSEAVSKKLPLIVPFAITIGIAPLLFVQVVYGHFFYASSVLMASYWIAVIPLLICAYYGVYIYAHRIDSPSTIARPALVFSVLCFLYIGFVYVNNFTMMTQPDHWVRYFQNRSGALLNLPDHTLIPRYLHFLAASVAVAGLVMAGIWDWRSGKGSDDYSQRVRGGLQIFGVATIVQFAVGFWFLGALPSSLIFKLLGGDPLKSALLGLGVLSGFGAAAAAFSGKFRPTAILLFLALLFMTVTRYNLRTLYLEPYFNPSQLVISPQYGVLALFLLVLIAGLAAVYYMIRISFSSHEDLENRSIGQNRGDNHLAKGGAQ
jgi:hypothetical protein